MSQNSSHSLSRELRNLGKDTDTRKSAMNVLKSYVKDLDSKAIPLFVARVSENKDSGASPGEYTIPLYEDLARVHGPNIVSQIDIIMGTIIRILTTSGGSFPLQQACSKIAPTIARYAIEPTTPEDEKKHIIRLLCKPLSDSILGSHESLSCGAALCLNALVECDNWRFASDDVVNEVCLRIAGALEDDTTRTTSHMALVMSLAKHNSLIVEAYAGLLISSGLEILNAGATERKLAAIQMINFLLQFLDVRSIYSELDLIIGEMEKCQSDEMPYVRGASFEALQIARKLKGPMFDPDVVSVMGSNGKSAQRYNLISRDQSPASLSPGSETHEAFVDNGLLVDSPFSTTLGSCNLDHNRNIASRKLWRYENGGHDISLKDAIFSEIARSGNSHSMSEYCEASNSQRGYYDNGFHGFGPATPAREGFRSRTPSPQRPPQHQISPGRASTYGTPRQLVQFSHDEEEHENPDFYGTQPRRFTSPCLTNCGSSSVSKYNSNSLPNGSVHEHKIKENSTDKERLSQREIESVCSTEDVPAANEQLTGDVSLNRGEQNKPVKKNRAKKSALRASYRMLLLFAVFVSVFWLGNEQDTLHLVPT